MMFSWFTANNCKQGYVGVENIHTCERDAAICNTLIQLGHGLNTVVVAEGVACGAQIDVLRKMGCDQARGFLLAEPMPADRVLSFDTALAERFATIGTTSSIPETV